MDAGVAPASMLVRDLPDLLEIMFIYYKTLYANDAGIETGDGVW